MGDGDGMVVLGGLVVVVARTAAEVGSALLATLVEGAGSVEPEVPVGPAVPLRAFGPQAKSVVENKIAMRAMAGH